MFHHLMRHLSDVFFLPGDLLLSFLHTLAPTLLERHLDPALLLPGGGAAALLSALYWLLVLAVLWRLFVYARAVCREAQDRLARAINAIRYFLHERKIQAACFAPVLDSEEKPSASISTEEIQVDEQALQVLLVAGQAAAGTAVSARWLGNQLQLAGGEVQRSCEQLAALQFLEEVGGARAGTAHYRISSLGSFYLNAMR